MTVTAPTSRKARSSRGSSARRSAPPAKRLLGHQTPRIYTPPLRKLTPRTSLGYDVIKFADYVRDRLEEIALTSDDPDHTLGLFPRLLEWQRWLLIHTLELLPGPDMVFRFRIVLLLVARQNGKSTLLTALILWRLFQDGAKMVIETHISLDHARKAWDEVCAVANEIPELADEVAKHNEGKASELFKLDGGETFKIASTNRRGGRGFSGDLVIFDELREHQDFKSWSATSKTTMARKRAQVWGVSNAGDSQSVLLKHLRDVALSVIAGDTLDAIPEDLKKNLDVNSIGLFEWSAGEVDGMPRSIWDREGWAESNPSLGYTELDERAIATAAVSDTEYDFRTEVLCQFVNGAGSGPFPAGAWAAVKVPAVTRDTHRPAAYCIDVSHDRTMAYIAIAFWDTEGRRRVEIAAQRAGTDWIIPWLLSPKRAVKPEHVTMQWNGAPVSSLVTEFDNIDDAFLKRHEVDKTPWDEITPWQGPDLARASGIMFDALRQAIVPADDDGEREAVITLTHGMQPSLDVAATSAVIKPVGDGWVINRGRSPEDAAPLVAAMGALWLVTQNPEYPQASVYETRGLIML